MESLLLENQNTQRVLTVPFEAGVEPGALSIHLASGQLVMLPVAGLLIARRGTSTPSRVKASRPTMTASNSIRLLVVSRNPSLISFTCSPYISSVPYPPGPGLPLAPPSVYMVTLAMVSACEI